MAVEALVGLHYSYALQITRLTYIKTRKYLLRRQAQNPHLPERSRHPHHQARCLHHRSRGIWEYDAQRPQATGNSPGEPGR